MPCMCYTCYDSAKLKLVPPHHEDVIEILDDYKRAWIHMREQGGY